MIRSRSLRSLEFSVFSDSNLIGLSDRHITTIGAGYRPLDQEQVIGGIDPHDFEVSHGDLVVAEMPRLADPFEGPGWVGAGAGGAGVAVHPLDAVRGPQAAEPMPLDDAGIPPALAGAGYVHVVGLGGPLDGPGRPLAD